MAQIIKHRRGSVDSLASATAKKGELIMATGSVGNMNGPWIFVGETEGSAGAFRTLSKIYQGSSAPDLTGGTYGSTLNGTPFYGSTNQSLYILSNSGNITMDLTGNIEGNLISGVTINNLTGTTIDISSDLTVGGDTSLSGDLYITGNTFQTGNIDLDGNIVLTGNITIGDQTTDIINFGGEVSSSIIPDVHNAFDLGSSDQNWRNLHLSGTAYVDTLQARQVNFSDLGILNDLSVSGTTYLEGNLNVTGDTTFNSDVTITGLTDNRIVIVGTSGVLEDDANFTFDGTELNVGQGNFTVQQNSGDIDTAGTLNVGGNTTLEGTLTVTGSATLKDNLIVSGTTTVGGETILEDNLSVSGTTTVVGVTTLQDDLNVSGNTIVDGTVVLNSTLEVVGNTSLDGTLIVTGSSTLKDNLNVSGNTLVGGTLTVTGDTQLDGNLTVSGNFTVLGSATEVHISSSVIELDDNIIRLNAYSPFERYAGFEVIDSGSVGVSASLVWDSQNDYWLFVSSSGESSKLIGTTAGTYGSENSLTNNTIVKATGGSSIGDSLLTDNATTLAYNTNKFTVDSSDGATLIAGNVTLSAGGGADGGTNTSAIVFRNASNILGYVSTTETTDELDGILGYKNSDGALVFSTVIDGGTY